MILTVVIFNAFNRSNALAFIKGETWEQIHAKLTEICNTYEPLHILQSQDAEPISLNVLNLLINKQDA